VSPKAAVIRFADRLAHLGTENAFQLGRDIARVEERGMEVVRLNLGEPDFDTAPHIRREAVRQIEAGNTGYTDPAGIPSLRSAIARHLARTRGLEPDAERVVVMAGAKPAIGYAMLSYVGPGDEVIYPSPGFPIYESWVTFVGGTPVPLPLSEKTGFAFDVGALADRIGSRTSLIILNSPSNPTGGVLSGQVLEEIARVILERASAHVRILSDEIYEHILFDGLSHESIVGHQGMRERTIVMGGHSKSFAMTGWRLGWAFLPTPAEAEAFRQLNINGISCVPPFVQEAGRVAYEDPRTEAEVSRMVQAFQERRDRMVDRLNRIPGVTCRLPGGAFYVFPNVAGVCRELGILDAYRALDPDARRRTSPSTLLQRFLLFEHGVATMDRSSFGRIGAEGEHFLRLSIANGWSELEKGVERLARGAADPQGFQRFLAQHVMA